MSNFLRALRLALRYRAIVLGTLFSAIMVGLLWGLNIGTVYPFVEVAFKGQTLQQWAAGEIAGAQQEIALQTQRAASLRAQLTHDPADAVARRELAQALARIEAENSRLARSQLLQPYIERYVPHDAFQTLLLIAGFLLLGTIVKGLFLIMNNVLVARLALLGTFDLRRHLFRRALGLDVAMFTTEGTGDLLSRFTIDMENVHNGLKALFGKALREPLKMAACLIGAALICWRLLLFSLVFAPLAAYLAHRLGRLLKRANRRAMDEMSQMYGLLQESFHGIRVVKAFTMERYERQRFHRCSKTYNHKAMRIARYEAISRPIIEVLGVAMILLALIGGAYLVLKGETHLLGIRMCDRPMSLSSLLLFYGLLSGVSDPARKMSEVFSRIQRAAASCDRIYALADRQAEVRDPPQPKLLRRHAREIVFDNVSFRYTDQTLVLQDIKLRVAFGQTVALVGPNGCGKSTLVNLLPRFFDPTSGSIRLDGIDLREVRLRDLRRQIGLVTQETLLFDDTVYNNIRYGCPHATPEQVEAAARQAHAHRFIAERLDHGYQTQVGPLGGQLSGGQRQRIALARAILRDPAILILDEATSQIDLESEQVIHRVLEQFIRNRTTFIITHRLSTLRLADRIVVMDAGRIVDSGTHDELLGRCALYRRLHEIQFRESA
jgi:subfamily B ATP-binding cassette protein MsbA